MRKDCPARTPRTCESSGERLTGGLSHPLTSQARTSGCLREGAGISWCFHHNMPAGLGGGSATVFTFPAS